jgi:PAS domain S-box-containing protein
MNQSPGVVTFIEAQRFEAFFEHASVGILVASADGVIQSVNKKLLQQFGYEEKSVLIGKKVELLIPSRYTHHHTKLRESYNKHPEPREMGHGRDLYATRKDGNEFPVEVSLSNYETTEGNFIIAFVIDITRRKETEKEVLKQQQELEISKERIEDLNISLEKKVVLRTSQLEEAMHQIEAARDELEKAFQKEKELGELKSRFVSMASHEFRTPLSTILSSASLVEKYTEKEDQEKRDRHTARIKSAVKNLTILLEEFLSLGKIEDGKIEAKMAAFDVVSFMKATLQEIENLKTPAQQVVFQHSGDETVYLDAALLRYVVYNLLSNAIKFSGDHGIIKIHSFTENNKFNLAVKDNGIGISKADQAHLFELFFRATNAVNIQGTGLGLHIVSRYVELMGGNIEFESELEKGTSFYLSFPQPPGL